MEKYKLKKGTFFYKTGTICKLTPKGNMVLDDCEGTCILHNYQLREHPELLDEWFEKIEEKKYGGRVPEKGDTYWRICGSGVIESENWNHSWVDESAFECGNAFWAEEEAEKELARRKAYVILKEDTKGFKPDWNNSYELKRAVYYDHDNGKFTIASFGSNQYRADLFFATQEDAEASIKAHSSEWRAWLGIEE